MRSTSSTCCRACECQLWFSTAREMLWYHSNKVGGLLLPFLAQSSLRSTATIMRCFLKKRLGQISLIKLKGSFEKGSSIEHKAAFRGEPIFCSWPDANCHLAAYTAAVDMKADWVRDD